MLRTIIMGTCVQVQGTFVRALSDGRIVVSVGDRDFAVSLFPLSPNHVSTFNLFNGKGAQAIA